MLDKNFKKQKIPETVSGVNTSYKNIFRNKAKFLILNLSFSQMFQIDVNIR